MKHLFDPSRAAEVKVRVAQLQPDSAPQWGRMTAPQVVAHCVIGLEWAVDDRRPPRMLVGRLFGPLVRTAALGDDAPMRRNSPTSPELRITDDRDLDAERARLVALVDRFAAGRAAACTSHPHPFFGRLSPEQWAVLMFKHLDHHLRQFGV